MYSISKTIIICVSRSNAKTKAFSRYCLKCLSKDFTVPSAMSGGLDTVQRLIWTVHPLEIML
jgi:hypothetical protein